MPWAFAILALLISLILFPITPPATKESKATQQESVQISASDKPPTTDQRPFFKGIYIDQEFLKSDVESEAAKYGLTEKLPVINYIIQNESGWRWWASNSKSAGLLSFTEDTWQDNCLQFGSYDLNPINQIDCGLMLMSKGQWWRWDVYCLKWADTICETKRGLYPQ